jgi:hypothetical protein
MLSDTPSSKLDRVFLGAMGKLETSCWQECVVGFFRAFAPLAILYTVYRIIASIVLAALPAPRPQLLFLPLGLEILIYVEVAFFVFLRWRAYVLGQRRPAPCLSREERRKVIERCLEHTADMVRSPRTA